MAAGLATLRGESAARLLVLLLAAQYVAIGALDVLVRGAGEGHPGAGRRLGGLPQRRLRAGGALGIVATVALIGRPRADARAADRHRRVGRVPGRAGRRPDRRHRRCCCWRRPGWHARSPTSAGRTLLQRAAPPEVLARVFGVLEGLQDAALAVGALLAPALVAAGGAPLALVGAAAVLPLGALLAFRRLRHVDQRARQPVVELCLLRSMPIFAGLPAPALEGVAGSLEPRTLCRGDVLIRQGEPGEEFFAIAGGELDVDVDGLVVRTLVRGDGVGEIALVRELPAHRERGRAHGGACLLAGEGALSGGGHRPRPDPRDGGGAPDRYRPGAASNGGGDVIDPLERWRELGEKPDYAGLLTFAGSPYTEDPAELDGRRRRDRRRADRRPGLRPPGHALRPARDPRRELPARPAPRGGRRRLRRCCGWSTSATRPVVPADPARIARGDRARPSAQVARRRRDPDRPRRRPLDRRARHPRLRRAVHGPVGLVHFDTHTDTGARSSASRSRTGRRCTGSSRRATSTPAATSRSACAATGPARRSSPGSASAASRASSCTTSATVGIAAVVERALGVVGAGPVFLTVDVDVLDPAFAPGTGTPEPGGMTIGRPAVGVPRDRRAAVELVGAEVVEVIPTAIGSADITALVGRPDRARDPDRRWRSAGSRGRARGRHFRARSGTYGVRGPRGLCRRLAVDVSLPARVARPAAAGRRQPRLGLGTQAALVALPYQVYDADAVGAS